MQHTVRLSHRPEDWVVVDHAEYVDAQREGRVVEEKPGPGKGVTKPGKEG